MPVLKTHKPALHDQLDYAAELMPFGSVAPSAWRVSEYSPIDWSGTAARDRRYNNLHTKATGDPAEIRLWNSGYFAAILISPMHAIVCGHYRRAVPSQVNGLRFIDRKGMHHRPTVARVLPDVGEDLDVVEFTEPLLGDFAIASCIADMRTAKPGLTLFCQSPQHMTYRLRLKQVGTIVETGGAEWAWGFSADAVLDGVSDGAGKDGEILVFSGDSGSPCFCLDRLGRQCLVGMLWGSQTISAGGTSKAAREFEALSEIVGAKGYWLELVSLANPADVNRDGVVDAKDLARVQGAWGKARPSAPEDIDGDGFVNSRDIGLLLGSWGAA